MIGLLLSIISGIGVVCTTTNSIDCKQNNDCLTVEYDENSTKIEWNNKNNTIDDKTMAFFDEYNIDLSEAKKSIGVIVQEEYIYDEYSFCDDLSIQKKSVMGKSVDLEEEFTHNKGYIKFITKAYMIGFYDGNVVYHIEVEAKQLKRFKINKEDTLIIRHGENAVTFQNDAYPVKGVRSNECHIVYTMPYDKIDTIEKDDLEPDYSCGQSGVCYHFKRAKTGVEGNISTVTYDNTTIIGDYYLVATDTTEVQAVYVHTADLFVESVFVSYGPIGVSVSTKGQSDVMEGKPITLKGFNDQIVSNSYIMNCSDWLFDGRYYFANEGIKETINYSDDLKINTKRLRCGCIENKYIVLSPNRINAGEAYLELEFNKKIYSFTTSVSFWSTKEKLYSDAGDFAYIQYLDENNKWITCADLLKEGLSFDKTNPKKYEFEIVEGTSKIRFIAKKNIPNSDWNKGRICIGEMKFRTHEIV